MTLVISGTNRKNSRSRAIADIYVSTLESQGDTSEVLSLDVLPRDFIFSALYENALTHPEVNKLQDKIDNTERIVFVISEYNGTFPGALKAFIDGLRYPDTFTYKKGALVGFSSNFQGCAVGLSHMADMLSHLGMYVLPQRVKIPHIEQRLDQNTPKLTDDFYQGVLNEQAQWFLSF